MICIGIDLHATNMAIAVINGNGEVVKEAKIQSSPKHQFPIEKMSKIFGVSRSGYYRWLSAGPSQRILKNLELKK